MAKSAEHLPKRYAKAFIEVILEMRGEKGPAEVGKELHDFSLLCTGEIGQFFANPVFDRDEKWNVLKSILSQVKVGEEVERFLRLIISLGHTHLLPEIARAFFDVDRERRNEVNGTLRSAFPVSEKEKDQIQKALSLAVRKNVLLDVQVDKELIGGVVAKVGSRVYDASVRSYLTRLQEEF